MVLFFLASYPKFKVSRSWQMIFGRVEYHGEKILKEEVGV